MTAIEITRPSGPPISANRLARPADALEVVRVVVLLQAATLVLTTLETAVWVLAFGPDVVPSLVVTGASAMLTFATAWGLGRGARWARRVTLVAETLICAGGLLDGVLALVVTGGPPPLMVVLTRISAPLLVIALLRRPALRARFGATTEARPR